MEFIREINIVREFTFDNFMVIVKKIHDVSEALIRSDRDDIKKKVNELDLADKMKEIESLMNDINNLNIYKSIQSINHAAMALHESIEKVHSDMNKLCVKLNDHSDKWFSYWRTVDYGKDMDDLVISEAIMNKRYTRLKDLLKINWNTFEKVEK